jgi:hypothetical protein
VYLLLQVEEIVQSEAEQTNAAKAEAKEMSVPEASRLRVEEWSKKPVPRPAVLDENGEEEEDADVADGLADFLIDSDAEGSAVVTLLPHCCHITVV